MLFMVPQITEKTDWYAIDTNCGTEFVEKSLIDLEYDQELEKLAKGNE
jgi:hypothetical protein